MESMVPVPRRRFINWLLGGTFGALVASVIYPIIRFASPPRIPEATTNQVEAGDVSDPVFSAKGFKIIRFGAEPVILLKASETEFRAFSATCTHLDCIVGYQKDRSQIFCNCHGGTYDLNGRNVAGPPPRPLIAYKVNLIAKGSEPAKIVVSRA
ncbi:MAG TPA: ubiquinol-cytochrome c reductase iron-sulfur subunit [Thermoanaerobaculia bacterium]|jgi:Rieske Fe-S protein|nr:ubiquinol-cytochrome c reductase iron-sulfur subunit [Thermoanaerobaculia bacterium]HXH93512.1 ubiquinol-cytochrome c reductase iron-sulfur subunit [Thermoanaerobaculia bacterium]